MHFTPLDDESPPTPTSAPPRWLDLPPASGGGTDI